MSECNHVYMRKLSSFFPWIAPEDDKKVRCFNKTEADSCPKCDNIEESHDKGDRKDD